MEKFRYNDKVVRWFLWATMIWGLVGMFVGLLIASELIWPKLSMGLPFLNFGRIRPLHTNAVIFAFAGNAIFCGMYYSIQRLLKARMFSDFLSWVHFWGWQLIIVAAAVTLPLGITMSKEYAELEWPIDLAITLVWVVFAINFFGTIFKRRERHLYVAIWFYIATILAIAVLHIVNSIELPVSFTKSYPVYAGVHDALVQWWYGHNAVAFFLTTPFLGLMYYFIPKAAERPVYSYRLSIIHFWSLVFLYIWAGPHHLLYSALPEWAQTAGMLFSVMLLAPSWGGMINGILTLRGAFDKLRTDPILKFLIAGVTFYGMSTFEGPMLSVKSVNALAHFTDWIIGHVHSGALGWNGFISFGMIYWLIPKLWKTPMYKTSWMNLHFWLGLMGIIIYVIAMWGAGITQGVMWRQMNPDGTLVYPDFLVTILNLRPFYLLRVLGGLLYFSGVVLMLVNCIKTIRLAPKELPDEEATAPALLKDEHHGTFHDLLERKSFWFSAFTLIALLVGTIAEVVPIIFVESNVPTITSVMPYSPLELEGRDLYVREGCYTCHSQLVRPFRFEVARYGEYSKAGEFVYDHPFQWGSRRIGPDLHRLGGKYPNLWHYKHMEDPRSTSPGSIMPNYSFMLQNKLDTSLTKKKLEAMKMLGVPYNEEEIKNATQNLEVQAQSIAKDLESQGVSSDVQDKEIIALIAYLQRLGTDIKPKVGSNVP